ncbi:MAG TPA: ABC transporter ATP-binding protein [Anaerolineales bacterium]|nr:ABC transporter ATP-binding protein [Anaerolineales bacterium]
MTDPAVIVQDFRKRYGEVVAADGINFEVQPGEIFGLLGPNGAGKTTTLECLEGIRFPDSGTLRVMGIDPRRDGRRLRDALGVQLQASGLPGDMLVEEAMRFFCAYHGVEPRPDLIERLGLAEKRRSPYRKLSTGQQRRLALALAVVHRPKVVLLDEPTAGLDVATRAELHALASELRGQGAAILLATHDMAEAEKLADRVAILLRGAIVAQGTPRQLTAAGAGWTRVSIRTESEQDLTTVPLPGVERTSRGEGYSVFFSRSPGETVTALLREVERRGDTLIDLRVERPSLEERFLQLTGQPEAA